MMKKFLLLLLVLRIPFVHAKTPPEKFQNPIFNDVLWSSNYNFAHDMTITPTYIDELDYDYDSTCEYITEDEKGILLKCQTIDLPRDKAAINYEMFYIRYKYRTVCGVWQCSFTIKNNIITTLGIEGPAAMYSQVYNCKDEIDRNTLDSSQMMNCIEELKARGWDKYLPGSLPDEK